MKDFTFNIILKQNGDVVNITDKKIEDKFDHKFLNDIFGTTNSTAEYMSKYIAEQVTEGLKEKGINAYCSKVELNETAKNMAIYEVK